MAPQVTPRTLHVEAGSLEQLVAGTHLSVMEMPTLNSCIAIGCVTLLVIGGILWWVLRSRMPKQEELEQDHEKILAQVEELRERIKSAEMEAAILAQNPVADATVGEGGATDSAEGDSAAAEYQKLEEAADAAVDSVQQQITEAYGKLAKLPSADEMLERAEALRKDLLESGEQAWASGEAFVRETTALLTTAVQDTIADDVTTEEAAEFASGVEELASEALTMPLPLLLAGTFAPMQLQSLAFWNVALMAMHLPTLVALSIAFAIDFRLDCGNGSLWYWTVVMLGILGTATLVRLRVVLSVRTALKGMRSTAEVPDAGSMLTGGALGSFWRSLVISSKDYFTALLAYDGISRSWSYALLNFLGVLCVIWGGVSVWLVISNVVKDDTACPAWGLRLVVRWYAFLYVVFAIWSIVSVGLWIGSLLLTNERAALAVVRRAWLFDQNYSPSGLPVVTLFVRGMLLRDAKDMKALEASVLHSELEELRQQQGELDKQATALDVELKAAEHRLEAASDPSASTESVEELAAKYTQQLVSMIDTVTVVGMAVAKQLETNGPAMIEQMQRQSDELLSQAREHARDVAEAAQSRALESGIDASVLVARGQEYAEGQAQQLTEAAQKYAQDAGLKELSQQGVDMVAGQAKQLSAAAQQQAESSGLMDMSELAQESFKDAQNRGVHMVESAKQQAEAMSADALEEVTCAALLQAQAQGIDIDDLIRQAQSGSEPGSDDVTEY